MRKVCDTPFRCTPSFNSEQDLVFMVCALVEGRVLQLVQIVAAECDNSVAHTSALMCLWELVWPGKAINMFVNFVLSIPQSKFLTEIT